MHALQFIVLAKSPAIAHDSQLCNTNLQITRRLICSRSKTSVVIVPHCTYIVVCKNEN